MTGYDFQVSVLFSRLYTNELMSTARKYLLIFQILFLFHTFPGFIYPVVSHWVWADDGWLLKGPGPEHISYQVNINACNNCGSEVWVEHGEAGRTVICSDIGSASGQNLLWTD